MNRFMVAATSPQIVKFAVAEKFPLKQIIIKEQIKQATVESNFSRACRILKIGRGAVC